CGSAIPPVCVPSASPPAFMMRLTRFSCISSSYLTSEAAPARCGWSLEGRLARETEAARKNRPSTYPAQTGRQLRRDPDTYKPECCLHRKNNPQRVSCRVSGFFEGRSRSRGSPFRHPAYLERVSWRADR